MKAWKKGAIVGGVWGLLKSSPFSHPDTLLLLFIWTIKTHQFFTLSRYFNKAKKVEVMV